MAREEIRAAGWGTAVFFWALALIIVGSAIVWWAQPYFIAKETQTMRQSNAYVTTQQTALNDFMAEYNRLEVRKAELRSGDEANAEMIRAIEGQQAGIVNQMKQRAALIPDHVSIDIRAFLSGR